MARRVVVESPYAGTTPEEVQENVSYARRAVRDCLLRGEAPFASHLLYTQPGILDDGDSAQRGMGMAAGLSWTGAADAVVVYVDRGITKGMRAGISRAHSNRVPVEQRTLGPNAMTAADKASEMTPIGLSHLLLSAGYDVSAEALMNAFEGEHDVAATAAWAHAAEAHRRGGPAPGPMPERLAALIV